MYYCRNLELRDFTCSFFGLPHVWSLCLPTIVRQSFQISPILSPSSITPHYTRNSLSRLVSVCSIISGYNSSNGVPRRCDTNDNLLLVLSSDKEYKEKILGFALTLVFVIGPAIAMTIFSLLWYYEDRSHYRFNKFGWFVRIFLHLILFAPLVQCIDTLLFTWKSIVEQECRSVYSVDCMQLVHD